MLKQKTSRSHDKKRAAWLFYKLSSTKDTNSYFLRSFYGS